MQIPLLERSLSIEQSQIFVVKQAWAFSMEVLSNSTATWSQQIASWIRVSYWKSPITAWRLSGVPFPTKNRSASAKVIQIRAVNFHILGVKFLL